MAWSGLLAATAGVLRAQTPPIQDNSFLLEEAYNQERGVVQHISLFSWQHQTKEWNYGFTQEWPFKGQRQQFSYSVPLARVSGADGRTTGIGDARLNYRFQLLGRGDARTWIAPRISAVLPTGRWRRGLGRGSFGVEAAIPVSIRILPGLTGHLNAGLNHFPRARNEAGERAATTGYYGGASLIGAVAPTFNLMLEFLMLDEAFVTGPKQTVRTSTAFLSPGVRWAYNFKSGLQIVPGVAYAFGLGSAAEESGLLLYLSFEHPFRRSLSPTPTPAPESPNPEACAGRRLRTGWRS